MEEIIEIKNKTEKIYKDRAIYVGTFLGGPLVAGYLIAENFKAFGEINRAKKTWVYAIITLIILFVLIFSIPDNVKIPNQIIPLIYTIITYYLVKYYQGKNIEEYISTGGSFFGWWRIIVIGLIGLVVTLAIVFLIVFITDTSATKTYGERKNEIAFDKSNITESEIDKLADSFTKTAFFNDSFTKFVYAKKVNSSFEISISCNPSVTSSTESLEPFVQLRNDIQSYFPNQKIVFNLVIDNLENIVKRIE